jgi:hypothetical protein
MAAREGQGLQIAVISFAMLTILLAITTYIFYAQAQTNKKDLEATRKQLDDQKSAFNKLKYQAMAMQYVLGHRDVTREQVDLAKTGDDPDVKDLLDNFDKDIALVGEQATAQGSRSYRTLLTSLMTALSSKNSSVADAAALAARAKKEQEDAELAANNRANAAEASSKKAQDDYNAEKQKFVEGRNQSEEEKKKLQADLAAAAKAAKDLIQKETEAKETIAKSNTQLQGTIGHLRNEIAAIRENEASPFERPDGYIKMVNQRQRLVWIDAGRGDGLQRQTTFSVFDHDENGISNKERKARIEVVNVGDRLSEARILEDKPSNPIIAGDVIFTPTWSPGQKIHFALALRMDINKDDIDDYEMVKNIIQMNGGVIDAELRPDGKRVGDITVNTRYFVVGQPPDEGTSQQMLDQFRAFKEDQERHGVEQISVEKLLSLMGWKAEERSVELAGPRATGDFRRRTPGKAQQGQKAGASGAPASDASPAPAAPAASDPFGSPPPAAAPAAPPAGADADPFAAPR